MPAAPADRFRVFGWAADESGCGFFRLAAPFAALRLYGHDAAVSTALWSEWARDSDIIVAQRTCLPEPSAIIRKLAADGRPVVYEIDDNLLDISPDNPAIHALYSRPDIRDALRQNIAIATLVTVSTEPLAELMRGLNPNVTVLPNCVPTWLTEHARPRSTEKVVIGWEGSATHRMDLAELTGPLAQVLRRTPGVEFHAMGTNYGNWLHLPRDRCRFTPWLSSVFDFWRAVDFDIGLAPLRPHPFNRTKSAIRCLAYAALGIPVVASNYGPYADFVIDGVTGYLVDRQHEWGRRLRDLVNDPQMRAEMGEKARAQARQWTIEGNVWRWEKTYRCLI
jgi:glycosyltransferase involved in cell wall biosynthesis